MKSHSEVIFEELKKVSAERDELKAILAELVYLKDTLKHVDPEEYERRKPLTWQKARTILGRERIMPVMRSMTWDELAKENTRLKTERDELRAQVAALRDVITDILPIAKGLSCCDWSEWVKKAQCFLSISDGKPLVRRQPK